MRAGAGRLVRALDVYSRQKQNEYHNAQYGPPSQFGFMEIDNLWHAEHWDPEKLMRLYMAAGAKYFVALANHEDNFDTYDSRTRRGTL